MIKPALTAALAIHAVWAEQANIRLHLRNRKLKQQVAAQAECIERLQTMCNYFGEKLDENEVALSEFDLIAIHNM